MSLRRHRELELTNEQQKLDITRCAQHMTLVVSLLTRDMELSGHSGLRVRSKLDHPRCLHNSCKPFQPTMAMTATKGKDWAVLCRLTADLERVRADSKTAESRLQQELHRAESRARLAQADAERQKAALDKERRYSSTKDQVHILPRLTHSALHWGFTYDMHLSN